MKNRLDQWITVVGFCAALGIMSLLMIFLPKSDFSETEKRNLAEFPVFNWDTLSSGEFGSNIEDYMADHIPGRDFLVGLNAYTELAVGMQVSKDIYTAAGDRLVEAPAKWNESLAQMNMDAINRFAAAVDAPVDLMLVPSAGWAVRDQLQKLADPYMDEELIAKLYGMADSAVNTIDMCAVYENADKGALYYRTDHHWTSLGAHIAYETYMKALGKTYRAKEDFTVETVQGFRGSTYSRSALWLTPAEPLELWHGSKDLTVVNGEDKTVHEGVFYRERLEEADKYTVYLDGNHSTVRIENPNGTGKLLVIRDSYTNCLGAFLAESYETVVLVDLRYYKSSISKLCSEESFDNILVCYSMSNFLSDTNLAWLR